MAKHNELGKWGEQLAADYLTTKGYSIVDRDFKAGRYELDIIAMDGNQIVFVEVKTRSNDAIDPVDAIDAKKIKRLAKAADVYLRMFQIRHSPRFDVVTVIAQDIDMPHKLQHYVNAFIPPLEAL